MLSNKIELVKQDKEFYLVASDYIVPNDYLGVAVLEIKGLGKIPTTLGEFLEHSDNPNCTFLIKDGVWGLWANNQDIYIGEKLTINKHLFKL